MKFIGITNFGILPFLFGLAIGLYFFTFNVIGKKFTHYPGDLGDGRLNNYFLEHSHKFLTGREKSLWNAPFMYPEKNVLTYSDNLIGTSPFYSVFRILGFDRETAYQLWFILLAIISYSACYVFLNILFKHNYAAVIGAMVFAFSMAIQSQLTHAQTFPRFPIPLAFIMLLLFSKDFKPIYFFLCLLMLVYQLYCGIYLGFMLSLPIMVMFLIVVFFNLKKIISQIKKVKWLFLVISSAIINILIALPLIVPYYKRSQQMAMNTYEYVFPTLPTINSYLYSQPGSLIWDFLSTSDYNLPAHWDHQIFAGAISTICMIFFFILCIIYPFFKNKLKKHGFDKNLIMISLTGLITFLLFFRLGNFSFYRILFNIPGFASMRSLTRIINVELIFFAIAVAFFSRILFKKFAKKSIMVFFILLALFFLDNYYKEGRSYRSEKIISQIRIKSLIKKMEHIPVGSIVTYEPFDGKNDFVAYQLDAMLATQSLGLVSVNAYTATSPGTYTNYWINLDSISRKQWFASNKIVVNEVFIIH